jgi:protein SCO1/2
MHPRLRLTLAAAGLLALVGLLIAALAIDTGGASEDAAPANGFAGAIRPDTPPQSWTLTDQEGRPFSLLDVRGRPAVLTFMYTTCDNDCPTMTQQIRGALDQAGRDVPVLAVSVDPARDTAARARRFVAEQRMTGRMRFLLGDDAQLQRVWRFYGVQPQEKGLEHAATVLVLDRKGVPRVSFPVDRLTPEGLAHDIRAVGSL